MIPAKLSETERYKQHTSTSPQVVIPNHKTATFITEMCQKRKGVWCESPEMVVEHLPKYLFP